MLFTSALAAAFISYTVLLNGAVFSLPNFAGQFLGIGQEQIGAAIGIVREMKNFPLSIFGNKLPQSQDKPSPPKPKPMVAGIKVSARSAAALDCDSNDIIFDQAAEEKWPIASITKLMTALVFLDHNPGWDAIYEVKKEDRREGGKIYLFYGDKVKIKDLFYTSLVASANTETVALVHSTGLTEEEFVEKMNEQARLLGMFNTVFIDSTGLAQNISTAAEIVKFAKIALRNEDIRQATLASEYRYKTVGGRQKVIPSTDRLLSEPIGEGIEMAGGKTGFTDGAGYCFVGRFLRDGHDLITVVLGAPSKSARFTETAGLVSWIFDNFSWPESVVNP